MAFWGHLAFAARLVAFRQAACRLRIHSAGDAKPCWHLRERSRLFLHARNRCAGRSMPEMLHHGRNRGIRSGNQSGDGPVRFVADPACQTEPQRLVSRPNTETDALYPTGYPHQGSLIIIGHSDTHLATALECQSAKQCARDVQCPRKPSPADVGGPPDGHRINRV